MRKTILLAILVLPIFAVLLYAFAAQKPAPKYPVGYDFGFGKVESRKLVWGARPGHETPHYHWTYLTSLHREPDKTKRFFAYEDWPGFVRQIPATSGADCPGKSSPDASDNTGKSEDSARSR